MLSQKWFRCSEPVRTEPGSNCRSVHRWLGATSGGPERLSCGDAALSGRQRAVCRAAPLLLRGVRDGARLAVAECQNRFRLERWNCSTTRNPAAPFGHEMTSGEFCCGSAAPNWTLCSSSGSRRVDPTSRTKSSTGCLPAPV
uniref:Protein Wnt n=1 Tax=Poeciliopsis prolifica TaxID=188132 RepID=A0A0S7EJT1_9TELE